MANKVRWEKKIEEIKRETYALYLACRDPRLPWSVRIFIACVAAYALSPVDLIPDFIPVLGYLDDIILIPLGVKMAIKMIPKKILAQARKKARIRFKKKGPVSRTAGAVILIIWAVLFSLLIRFAIKLAG